MECDHTFEDVDGLLKRDWFLDTQDILGLFWELPEDTYLKVIDRRRTYAPRIRDLLEFKQLPRPIRIRDFSEAEVRAERDVADMARERWMRAHRKAYVAPPRMREDADTELDAVSLKLATKRALVEELTQLTNKMRKYVPPSQRANMPVDPIVRDAMADIRELENEFSTKTSIIDSINKTWTDLNWLDALHRDVVKRSIPSHSNAGAS